MDALEKREYMRKWREKNKEKVKKQQALYREKNREAIYNRHKKWQDEHKDRVKEYSRKYKEKNLEKNVNLYADAIIAEVDATIRRRREEAEAVGIVFGDKEA